MQYSLLALAAAVVTKAALYDTSTANHSCVLEPAYRSCSAKANPSSVDTCCVETFGGLLLATQFWNVWADKPLPKNSWTLHGMVDFVFFFLSLTNSRNIRNEMYTNPRASFWQVYGRTFGEFSSSDKPLSLMIIQLDNHTLTPTPFVCKPAMDPTHNTATCTSLSPPNISPPKKAITQKEAITQTNHPNTKHPSSFQITPIRPHPLPQHHHRSPQRHLRPRLHGPTHLDICNRPAKILLTRVHVNFLAQPIRPQQ